jgi:(+)-trans-carveol dehydrogenase
MGRIEGKVALITGAARGMGRSHATTLAKEGADIIAIDCCEDIGSVPYHLATDDDLQQTVTEVTQLGRRIRAVKADVRDFAAIDRAVCEGVEQFGRLDVVVANAGIATFAPSSEMELATWNDVIDINLTGVWHTVRAAVRHVVAGARGGSIVLVGSGAGLKALPFISHYVAAKHGIVGLTKSLALELGPANIRVNSVHPGNIDTPMFMSDTVRALYNPAIENPTLDDHKNVAAQQSILPTPWLDPVDVSNAIAFLTSDDARYITGVALPIDAGFVLK